MEEAVERLADPLHELGAVGEPVRADAGPDGDDGVRRARHLDSRPDEPVGGEVRGDGPQEAEARHRPISRQVRQDDHRHDADGLDAGEARMRVRPRGDPREPHARRGARELLVVGRRHRPRPLADEHGRSALGVLERLRGRPAGSRNRIRHPESGAHVLGKQGAVVRAARDGVDRARADVAVLSLRRVVGDDDRRALRRHQPVLAVAEADRAARSVEHGVGVGGTGGVEVRP